MSNHVDPVPDWLNSKYMQNILRTSLKKPDLTVDRIDVNPGSSVGDNYACQIFRINVFFKNGETLPIIGKLKPKTKIWDELGDEVDAFHVETLFFSEVLDRLNQVKPQLIPISYHIDYENLIIFMEDLRTKNFEMQPRTEFLNFEQAKLVIEALAVLHGASYLVVEKDPSLKKKFEKSIYDDPPNVAMKKMLENAFSSLEKWVKAYGLTDDQERKILGLRTTMLKNWYKITKKQDGRLNVLCHGDCWKSNVMLHKSGGKTDQVCLIDFQCLSYNSFANDLQYFLFSSVQSDVILANLETFLECYFKKIRETAPSIPDLSFERIRKEFDEKYFFGVVNLIFRAFMVADTPPDLDVVLNGNQDDGGYNHEVFIKDMKLLVPFFEKAGAL